MREVAIYTAIGLWVLAFLALSLVTIRYRITPRLLVITWLGVPVRWVRLQNIRRIKIHPVVWAERWYNRLTPGSRFLLIERYSGVFCRHLAITPKNHLVFKADLERARERVLRASTGRPAVGDGSDRNGADPASRIETHPDPI